MIQAPGEAGSLYVRCCYLKVICPNYLFTGIVLILFLSMKNVLYEKNITVLSMQEQYAT